MEGAATSISLSASWASSVIFPVSGVYARTIQVFDGSRYKKSSWYWLSHQVAAACVIKVGMAFYPLIPCIEQLLKSPLLQGGCPCNQLLFKSVIRHSIRGLKDIDSYSNYHFLVDIRRCKG